MYFKIPPLLLWECLTYTSKNYPAFCCIAYLQGNTKVLVHWGFVLGMCVGFPSLRFATRIPMGKIKKRKSRQTRGHYWPFQRRPKSVKNSLSCDTVCGDSFVNNQDPEVCVSWFSCYIHSERCRHVIATEAKHWTGGVHPKGRLKMGTSRPRFCFQLCCWLAFWNEIKLLDRSSKYFPYTVWLLRVALRTKSLTALEEVV